MAIGLNSQYQRYIAVAAPILSLITAYALVVPRYQTLKADEQALASTQAQITEKMNAVAVLKDAPKGPPYAHVPATRTEPVEFYQHLNQVARQCGIKLARYTWAPPEIRAQSAPAQPPPPPVPGLPQQNAGAAPSPQTNAPATGLPPGITPASVNLSVAGPYARMALFYGQLETYPRLVSINSVKMAATKYPEISADFKLTRYTSPPQAPTGPAAAQPQ
jgi:hypothetical protein